MRSSDVVVEVGVDRLDLVLGGELQEAARLREQPDVRGVAGVHLLLDRSGEVLVGDVLDVDAAALLEGGERRLEILLLVTAESAEDRDHLVAIGRATVHETTHAAGGGTTTRGIRILQTSGQNHDRQQARRHGQIPKPHCSGSPHYGDSISSRHRYLIPQRTYHRQSDVPHTTKRPDGCNEHTSEWWTAAVIDLVLIGASKGLVRER